MAANGRPFGVTLVALIAWINGALTTIQGIFTLLNPPAGDDWAGWVAIAIGVVTILVSFGLFGGNTAARVIVTIVFVLNLVSAVIAMFTGFGPGVVISAVISAALAVIGILLLYTRRANEFFRA
ncbi:hypothetical protein G5T42_07375 [Microbacterium sp. 4R-513]|uniref:hypothetical protein n=1 Tax=Microbacterium sp. 4R-513 TaxID=2567934 RepID=UPI0013E1A12B|nr:hypothetical protein [Microbacterium sp. 4R-513]QIG39329.1 hypothetical protein G5T42_07375 [Microbacterium sp. 4R-513]